ncbi:reverse transcriptase domain-containing protein [Tanacetum coccineum]
MDDTPTMAQLLKAPTVGYEDAIVVPEITADNFKLKHDHFYDEVPERPEFDETVYEAWDRFNDLLRACPHHVFLELHQLDTFYNALNSNDQDSLNSAVGGNFFDKMPRDCLRIIESKSKDRNSRNKPVVAKVILSSSTPALIPVKAVEESCVTCGGAHAYRNCPATDGNVYRDNIQEYVSQATAANFNQGNTVYRAPIANQIRPPGFPPVQQNQGNNQNCYNQNRGNNYNQASTYQPPVNQGQIYRPPINQPPVHQAQPYQAPAPQTQGVSKDDFQNYIKSNDAVMRNVQNQTQNMQSQMTNLTDLLTKFMNSNTASTSGSVQPQVPNSEPVVAPVSALMPHLKPSIPYPSRCNDEKRREKANDQIEKFYEIFKDLSFEISLTDALILMPKFVSTLKALIGNKEKLSKMARTPLNEHCSAVILNKLPKKHRDPGKFLIPCDFLEMDEFLALADLGASINLMPLSVWEKLSLPEPLLLTGRALIDVYKGELTLRVEKEAITFNLDQTSRYSSNYNDNSVNRIDVIEMACEEYSQEVLDFSDVIVSGNRTPYYDPIVSTSSPALTPYGDSDFLLLEEVNAFLALEDDPTSPEVNDSYYDSEGDILLLEAILNSDPSPPPPNQGNYFLEIRKELKVCEAKTDKSSIDEPPEVELKDLPPHLEYAFLEGDNKLPVIIAKDLSVEEKVALIKVLKSHKRAIAWKLSDIKDSPWVSPVHCVPKKGSFTVVKNDENELIPTRLVTGWRVCIDYRKLNEATRKDHFPLPFMDQMLERLAGNEYYCFLDGFSGYFQIPIDPHDQEKTTFTCPYGMFAYRRMPFGLCNAPGTFQRCMMAIFHDMIEKMMEVFMDDFSVFRNSFGNCLSRVDKMLQRCEDTNLCLNWEKSHFMVKEGIVLGHKISKNGIEVDKAKVDVIAKLPRPTNVKGVRTFLGYAGFYRRFIKDFPKFPDR